MAEEPANLPALAQNQGGALVEVLGWQQYLMVLDRTQQTQIAIVIRSFPDLNTVQGVDLLADAMVFYGLQFGAWFAKMLEENGIETITMALEVLHQYSVVGGAEELIPASARPDRKKEAQDAQTRKRLELEKLLELIGWLREMGRTLDTFEQVDIALDRLGGWEVARLLDQDQVEEFLSGQITLDELREAVKAPHDSKDGRDDEDRWR